MYSKFEKLLSERKITSYRVSKETGISNTTFSDWKRKKSKPKLDKLLAIAKYFDVPVEYFAEDELTEQGEGRMTSSAKSKAN